jgi:hypothetical protein
MMTYRRTSQTNDDASSFLQQVHCTLDHACTCAQERITAQVLRVLLGGKQYNRLVMVESIAS